MSTDFWTNLMKEADLSGEKHGSIDDFLSGKDIGGPSFDSVRDLTDKVRAAKALSLPVEAGTRVSFKANLGAVMTYDDPPMPGSEGVVVTVKSANGMVTAHEGKVFVQWDDGKFRSVHAEHLRQTGKKSKSARMKTQAAHQIRVASLGDLTDFFKVAEDTLIHRSSRDLWSFRQDGGDFVIERLFDGTGEPLKG